MKKNVFVLHSLNGDTLKFWGKDVKEYLKTKGIETFSPDFPIRAESSYDKFNEILSKNLKNNSLNENSIVVGHSIACSYFLKFMREQNFIPKYFVAVAPGAVYDYPTTRTDYILKIKDQACLKNEDFDFGKNLKNVFLVYSDEDDGNMEKFQRFEEDFNAISLYLKGYNHFDGYHRIYKIPELLNLLDYLLSKKKHSFVQCVQNGNKNVTPQDTIKAIKNAGFDKAFVQFSNKEEYDFTLQQQIDLCKKLNLNIEFAHLSYANINDLWAEGKSGDNLIEKYKKELVFLKQNKIPMAVMHLTRKSVAPQPSETGIKRLQIIADYAKRLNIKIAFENTKIPGYLEYVFEHIKNKNIGVCFDSGHFHCHFDDMFNWEFFKDKIFAVHLHDNDKSDDLHLLPFDGTLDWIKLCQNLKNANFSGPITLESCYRFDYLNMSLQNFYNLSLERAKKIDVLMNVLT